MEQLIKYTGGSFVLTIMSLALMSIALLVNLLSTFISIKKNNAICKTKKVEYFIIVISNLIIAIVLGGTIGYYLCLLKMI